MHSSFKEKIRFDRIALFADFLLQFRKLLTAESPVMDVSLIGAHATFLCDACLVRIESPRNRFILILRSEEQSKAISANYLVLTVLKLEPDQHSEDFRENHHSSVQHDNSCWRHFTRVRWPMCSHHG